MSSHRWHKYKCIAHLVCLGCGLVRLRNPLTDWCVRHGCDYDDHPNYMRIVQQLGRPK